MEPDNSSPFFFRCRVGATRARISTDERDSGGALRPGCCNDERKGEQVAKVSEVNDLDRTECDELEG
ncbi:MAG: hypothetical protein HGB29_00250 [Chlorobiaceae bacterium]|nr:hypothetical protein [Chlorobiaceae bacterium]NTW73277.1 hypothetical protein [Chlorobiaceae bacterium]